MEKDALGEVIEAEKRISERLEEEKRKAGQYLEEVKEETAREGAERERKLADSLEEAVREAEAEAGERAEEIRRRAKEYGRKLGALEDASLKRHVLGRIAAILPEAP